MAITLVFPAGWQVVYQLPADAFGTNMVRPV
jgi:hypothetical protein